MAEPLRTPWTPPYFILRAAAGSPCSASCHGVQVFYAAVPIQKNSSLGSPPHRVLRSICAVPTRAIAMVFETAPCRVVDLRSACEPSSKIFGEPLASIPLFLDLRCLIKCLNHWVLLIAARCCRCASRDA
ncbi:hypothetical protein Zm00014a_025558 [Zea mays]|uniref:Uncharacterized protein n=1 Tax=Zea mays TaxID=4577 RepID=A0A317Y1T6_MAIZE|nr:hypothetical protein Zm00014a_025558 [Zea mays]